MAKQDTVSTLFRQITSVTDESFSTSRTLEYHLHLSIHKTTFLFSVVDPGRNKVIALSEYDLGRLYSSLQTAEQIKLLFEEHAWLAKNQWGQIRCEFHQWPYTLLPVSLFEPSAIASYFRLAGSFDEDHETLLSYTHRSLDLVVIFSASNYLVKTVKSLQSAKPAEFVHGASAFIEGLLHSQPRTANLLPYILIESQHATITLLRDGAVLYCNTFYFTTPEDFIYYVILVLQEHQLNPETDPLLVWGELTPDSGLFSILQKYVRNVALGKRPSSLNYSYRIEDLFAHRYFDLYSLSLCN